MVDIETLGTDSNSVIVSISAIECDLRTGKTGDEFVTGIDIQEQLDKGAVMNAGTVMWWLGQSKEAQSELLDVERVNVMTALYKFNRWVNSLKYSAGLYKLWGNGATFDNVIIRNLHYRHGTSLIIPSWNDRDVRTVVDLANINTRDFEFTGVKHKGLDDCKHQIKYCAEAYKRLGL